MFDSPLLSKPLFRLRQISRRLWVRTSLIAALALVSAAVSRWLGAMVPAELSNRIEAGAVTAILEIIASSMLAVTTFSLSVMMVARQWASNQSTPRAHQVVLEDTVTQNVLATFLGAFIFSLVSLVLVETGIYSARSTAVILGFTIVVIALVVVAMLRWIDHLSDLGGVSETAGKIEAQAEGAFKRRLEQPSLGGHRCSFDDIPGDAPAVTAERSGYIKHVDASILNDAADEENARVWIAAPPGFYVASGQPLVRMTAKLPEDTVRGAFVIGDERSFDQDPAYGLLVLAEIAQRALSPGINDPGTAISVISRLLRILIPVAAHRDERDDPPYPRISVPPVTAESYMLYAFAEIALDGAYKVEVQI